MNSISDDIVKEKYKEYLKKGYLEAFLGMNSGKTYEAKELHSIAEKSECHNTGWPIGVTLTRSEVAPYSTEDGIEAIIPSSSRSMFDYWSLKKKGDFYFVRTYEEDEMPTKSNKGKNILWMDMQIWRISELLLYCLNLGKELQLDFTNNIDIYISYNYLKDRVLACNNPRRLWLDSDLYICKSEIFEANVSRSLDYIKVNYKDLVFSMSSELASYFGRFNLERANCDEIVDEFLRSRV